MSTAEGGGNIVTDGLILYLDAANTKSIVSGSTTWTDISRSGNNGTLINGPAFNSGNGGSIVFDNVNDYVTLGTPPSLAGLQVPLTINVWAKPNTITGLKTLYGIYGNVFGGNLTSLLRIDTGVVRYYTSNTSGAFQFFGTLTVTANIWYFFSVTVSGSISSPNITITVNNQSESGTLTPLYPTPNTAVDIRIGGNQSLSDEVWSGNISNVRIYNRALSAAEVLQNYNATKYRFGL